MRKNLIKPMVSAICAAALLIGVTSASARDRHENDGHENDCTGGQTGSRTVPDGGSTIAMLGFALVGVSFLRNKMNKA